MKNHVIISAVSCAIVCFNANADWYEATGQALVEQGNFAQAKQEAIDDAVKRAALAAGASVSSTQRVLNGVLQAEQLGITSHGAVKKLQLISESQNGNMLTVTVRVDIEADVSACKGNIYRKPILLSQIKLQARQDAIHGQLFNLGSDATVQLERHLRDYSPAAIVNLLPYSATSEQLVYPDTDRLFNAGNQYILLARINDLSLGPATNRFWQQQRQERFFALDVSLYDLFEQHLVFQQEYRTSASWSQSSDSTPASHSQAFWQLPYGQKIDQVLQAVAEDVQRQLQCEPLLASIKQAENNQLMLELGKAHGLQNGDQLQLLQLQRHPSNPGVKHVITSPVSLTITELTERHVWVTSKALLQHIQQGDIVSVRKNTAN